MPEVQSHGFYFEKWVRDTFFNGYETKYSSKWDIDKEANIKYGKLPVSIKTAKYGSPIGLGDAIRQISIDEDFILIAGFWKQEGNLKRIVNVTSTEITKSLWKALWTPLTLKDIIKLDKLIKCYDIHYSKIRKDAQILKSTSPYCDCLITLNPKIDSKNQRRLQCSIGFNLHFNKIATESEMVEQPNPTLWNTPVPKSWESGIRKFNKHKPI